MLETGEGAPIPKQHDTLHLQTEYRRALHPTREQEMDFGYVTGLDRDLSGPPSNLEMKRDPQELRDIRRKLQDSLPMTPEQVTTVVEQMSPEEAKRLMNVLMDSIHDKTGYFSDILTAEAMSHIFQAAVNSEKGAVSNSGPIQEKKQATFADIIERVYKGVPPPSPKDTLEALGTLGMLPADSEKGKEQAILTHQDNRENATSVLPSLFKKVRGSMIREDLVGVFAKRAAGDTGLVSAWDFLEKFPYDSVDIDRGQVFVALRAIDQLQALDMRPDQIIKALNDPGLLEVREESFKDEHKIVNKLHDERPKGEVLRDDNPFSTGITEEEFQGKKWKVSDTVYNKLQRVIDQRAEELNLDEYDLQNLVDADRLERQIDRLHVMQIVQQTLVGKLPTASSPASSGVMRSDDI